MPSAKCQVLNALLLLYKLRRPPRQSLDTFCDRGMRREQAAEVHPKEWLNDEQVCG